MRQTKATLTAAEERDFFMNFCTTLLSEVEKQSPMTAITFLASEEQKLADKKAEALEELGNSIVRHEPYAAIMRRYATAEASRTWVEARIHEVESRHGVNVSVTNE